MNTQSRIKALEHTSNSVVLRNILADESCELKRMIDAFMGEKLAEFQTAVKQNVDKVVAEKISDFYTPPNPELDDIVFDEATPTSLIGSVISNYEQCVHTTCGTNKEYYSFRLELTKKLDGQKCFRASISDGMTLHTTIAYIFKNAYLYGPPVNGVMRYDLYTHTLPTNILLVIKYFGKVFTDAHSCSNNLDTLQKYHTDHPEYFQPNCREFERVCQQEYAEIERRKQEFEESTKQSNEIIEEAHRIIDENVSKKEYYESLEQRIGQLEIEEERIREEKQKMVLIKERLLEMKAEIAREREEFKKEKKLFMAQKNKTIDIDKCFEDLL